MKSALIALVLIAFAATSAAAQGVNLSGRYRCVQNCRGTGPAYATEYGWNLNLVNEVGEPSRAWIDWSGHIWAENWHMGAVYAPDGLAIQFDDGAVWQRDLRPAPTR